MYSNSINLIKKENYPWIFTGLAQSDGSFSISIIKTQSKIGLVLRPFFNIELKDSSVEILIELQNYFGGCGRIFHNKSRKTVSFEISDFYSLWHILIPHFINYPLEASKLKSFIIFTNCMILLFPYHNKNKPKSLIYEIIKYSYFMNEGTKRNEKDFKILLSTYFSDHKKNNSSLSLHITQNFFKFTEIELNTILGIIEGDGTFYISFDKGFKFRFGFNITTSIKDLPALYKIKWRLGCGKVYVKSESWCRFEITKNKDLLNIIIPVVNSLEYYRGKGIRLLSSKSQNFEIFKEALITYEKGFTKTLENRKTFIEKYYNMYESGNKRKQSLKDYLTHKE